MSNIQAESVGARARRTQAGAEARGRLLTGLPVKERRLDLAGISTAVLEGGEGPPLVLPHGPGEHAPKWLRVIPELAKSNHVIAPDLPGHGTTEAPDEIDIDRVLAWVRDLIASTCAAPPVLVGQIIGGAIAARFAARGSERLDRLVLSDALGIAPFRPAPEFGAALMAFVQQPTEETHDRLWERCAFDLDRLRDSMGESWDNLRAYNLDRARAPKLKGTQQRLMELFGIPAIPPEELARIAVPTTLIWGRHDLATSLSVAEAASTRFGWPLHVIEDAADDPPIEQPDAFVRGLRAALARSQ
ncbi:MAG: alpha/beta hydrolase [Xanthobacteraceae bacterium]